MKNDALDLKKVTGWDTYAEYRAYDLGREHEQKVFMDWIEKWDGSDNSQLGWLLKKKFTELKDVIT